MGNTHADLCTLSLKIAQGKGIDIGLYSNARLAVVKLTIWIPMDLNGHFDNRHSKPCYIDLHV